MRDKYYDMIGVYAAFLCLIHCVLGPILFLLPLGLSHNPIIDCAFLMLGIIPVYKVLLSKASVYIKILLVIFFGFIAFSIAMEVLFHKDSFLIYIGTIGIISCHLINYKNHKH